MYNNSIRNVMKKTLIVIIAAVATIACTKEANNQDNLTPEGGLLSFEATVSSFVDNETKASIAVNGSGVITGTFSWSEGDQIAFPVTGSPEYVALTYNTENGKFEGKMDNSQSIDRSRKLYYPASRVIGTPYSTDFTSIDDAKAGFKMSADVPESLSSKITLEHESALVHVQFTNMPDFADQLVVNDGSSDVATISTEGASGTINFLIEGINKSMHLPGMLKLFFSTVIIFSSLSSYSPVLLLMQIITSAFCAIPTGETEYASFERPV